MHVLTEYRPNWRSLSIHESSPGWDAVSQRLAKECSLYTASQYDISVKLGTVVDAPGMPCKAYRNENLERQTFQDGLFDVVVAQDVFEHIFFPDLAIKDIARTLKPGGIVLMTVPIVNRHHRPSQRRAALSSGEIIHRLEPQYHGNPISKDGSLVTIDWGYDIAGYLQHHSGMSVLILQIDNIDLGIRADFNEILLCVKHQVPHL
jgi:SAM-dependent methyltransferase